MAAENCWEFKKCGRQVGGAKVVELGLCPAATEKRLDGINRGSNGGRTCWFMAGTLCGGQVQGSFAAKITNCRTCEFYVLVMKQEGGAIARAGEVLAKLK